MSRKLKSFPSPGSHTPSRPPGSLPSEHVNEVFLGTSTRNSFTRKRMARGK